jgi:hypothetical protein
MLVIPYMLENIIWLIMGKFQIHIINYWVLFLLIMKTLLSMILIMHGCYLVGIVYIYGHSMQVRFLIYMDMSYIINQAIWEGCTILPTFRGSSLTFK